MSNITKTAYWVVFVLLVIMVEVRGRSFGLNTQGTSSSQLVSDGIDHEYQNESTSSLLLLKRIENRYSTESSCEQLYGFLPCSNSVFGHVFLMVVYEYLLFHGESYLAAGGEQIFKILGPGVFGASAFHVIGALPESLLLLASGFFNSKEIAQEYVYTGVGLLAGSSILSLTILWGTCVIVSSQEFSNNLSSKASNDSNSSSFSWKRLSASLTDWGTTTDSETSSLARIMIFRPWVQKRRLEFVKLGHLVSSILQHIQKHALARVLTVKGAPNIPAIRRLFEEVDDDGDNYVSPSEVRELLCEIKFISTEDEKDKGTEEVMKQFDLDHDGKINKDEFINGLDQVSA
nr:sodium/calcium exchanger NCL-like isoform X2 [Malus domestica]